MYYIYIFLFKKSQRGCLNISYRSCHTCKASSLTPFISTFQNSEQMKKENKEKNNKEEEEECFDSDQS